MFHTKLQLSSALYFMQVERTQQNTETDVQSRG